MTSSDCSVRLQKCSCRVMPTPVRGVAGLEFRIESVRRFEICRLEGATVALEAVAQRRERTVTVHPFAEIREDLLAGLVAVERFKLRPLLRLGLPNETQYHVREDRARTVDPLAIDWNITVREEMRFYRGLEGKFGMPTAAHN